MANTELCTNEVCYYNINKECRAILNVDKGVCINFRIARLDKNTKHLYMTGKVKTSK